MAAGNRLRPIPDVQVDRAVRAEPLQAPDMPAMAHIRKVANGFVIEVGCKMFVAKSWSEASNGLGNYWKNPVAAEKKYCK